MEKFLNIFGGESQSDSPSPDLRQLFENFRNALWTEFAPQGAAEEAALSQYAYSRFQLEHLLLTELFDFEAALESRGNSAATDTLEKSRRAVSAMERRANRALKTLRTLQTDRILAARLADLHNVEIPQAFPMTRLYQREKLHWLMNQTPQQNEPNPYPESGPNYAEQTNPIDAPDADPVEKTKPIP